MSKTRLVRSHHRQSQKIILGDTISFTASGLVGATDPFTARASVSLFAAFRYTISLQAPNLISDDKFLYLADPTDKIADCHDRFLVAYRDKPFELSLTPILQQA